MDVEALVRAMVFNRLCEPDSKLGCLRWLETVAMPAMPDAVTHQHLLRAMDALIDHADRVESELAKQIRPLVDRKHSPWAVWRFVVMIVYRVSLWTHTRTSPACKFYRFLTRVVGAGGPMMRRSGSLRKALAMA
jgi:hypothetical protein